MNLTQLRTEILSGPYATELASAVAAANEGAIAAVLNDTGRGATQARTIIDAYEIVNATAPADWTALTAAEKQRYQTIVSAGKVDVSNPNITSAFAAMFGAGTATRTALLALATRQASRAEKLFGGAITELDVRRALWHDNGTKAI